MPKMGYKFRYTTSIHKVALPKKFSFVRWSLFEAFDPKYIDILILRVFSPYIQGVLEMGNAMKWANH